MDTLLVRYAELVIKQQLQLRLGESLSINTESSTIEFARLLARMAAETTREPVHIVETKHGKVLQVYPIDPQLNDALRPPVSGLAMCHIVDLDSAPYYSEESPQDLAKDVVQLGRFGILADPPELERRLAAPWANVPYPGPDWGLQYLGNEATEGDMWKLFMSLFRLDAHDPAEYWSNQAGMMNLRKRILNQHLADTITLRDQDWELMVRIAMDTQWTGGETVLSNGRKFLSQLPLQHVYASVDTQSANGSFLSSRPFLLLGKLVRNARFVVEGGEVTGWSATQGKQALDAFFDIDEGARRICEISLADDGTRESNSLSSGSHPLFNKSATCHIGFGGFQTDTLARQFTPNELDEKHLGQSLVRLDVPIGSPSLSVTATDKDGFVTPLMEDGVFVAV